VSFNSLKELDIVLPITYYTGKLYTNFIICPNGRIISHRKGIICTDSRKIKRLLVRLFHVRLTKGLYIVQIFGEAELRGFLDGYLHQLKQEVHNEEKNRFLNVNEEEYINYLVANHTIGPLEILWDDISISDHEEMIRAERFPRDFHVRTGGTYPKQIVTYHVPFSGLARLLSLAPSSRLMWSVDVNMHGNTFSFDIINWRDNPDDIKREADQILRNLRQQSDNVTQEVSQYNDGLRRHAEETFKARKAQLLKQSNLLESLGVPVKKASQVASTFAIPAVKKKTIIEKPKSSATPYKPEPALDGSIYKDILKICHDAGVEIERHPSIYQGKDEETLRDHFLMVLSPHFESATGETFNNSGKTDILIRHENANVFVGECKFWKGPKQHAETIDQLLGYLTWRDSKAAILYFIPNKQLNPVLDALRKATPEHPCFVKDKGSSAQGWFDYRFHLPGDDTRSVEVAVLCFHFPRIVG